MFCSNCAPWGADHLLFVSPFSRLTGVCKS